MESRMRLAFQVGFLVITSLQATQSLVIKQEPSLDTELYVAPSTYSRKDGKALPSTIIISRPLGINRDTSDESDEDDLPQGSFAFVPAREKNPQRGSIDLKPNIKFYKIECTSGRSCTSIIPARTTEAPEPLEIPFTEMDLKQYLAQFGLYNGFPYNDDYENSGSPAKPSDESDRAFGSGSYEGNSYWPGSAYRPNFQPSKAQVIKFQHFDSDGPNRPIVDFPTQKPMPEFSTRRPFVDFPIRRPATDWSKITDSFPTQKPDNIWEKVPAARPIQNDKFHHELPRPLGIGDDDAILPPYGPPRPSPPPRATSRPTPYDGVWNRYGVSTVSQLDTNTGEWVKISSSSTKLDQGIFDFHEDPSSPAPPVTYRTKAGLTVLGISDREPHSSFSDSSAIKPHTVKIPSAYPGNPPETIETDGGYVQSIGSVPFTISYPYRPSDQTSLSDIPTGFTQVSVPFSILSSQPPRDPLSDDPSSTDSTTTTTTTTSTTTTTTTTTTTPPSTTTTTKPPAQANTSSGTFLDNPYAVMAAVGAGLIPATFAALLPVFVGRRRRRRSTSVSNDYPSLRVPGISERLLVEMGLRVRKALIKNGTTFER